MKQHKRSEERGKSDATMMMMMWEKQNHTKTKNEERTNATQQARIGKNGLFVLQKTHSLSVFVLLLIKKWFFFYLVLARFACAFLLSLTSSPFCFFPSLPLTFFPFHFKMAFFPLTFFLGGCYFL